jgi:hypothetical protein
MSQNDLVYRVTRLGVTSVSGRVYRLILNVIVPANLTNGGNAEVSREEI